jgi:hypothetical protein
VLLSLYVPVAVNCCVAPMTTEELAGVTAIDTNVGAVTVKPVEPLVPPKVAWIVVLPAATPVARPPLVIVAAPGFVEVQVTELVRFRVPLSLNSPVAVNCCVAPVAIEALAGVTVIDTNTDVTVRLVEPLIEPKVACIVLVPVPTPVAKPPLAIVATPVLVELQVTKLVTSCVLVSLYVPVAVNCCVVPLEMDGFAGVTAIDTNAGTVTVRLVEPLIEPEVA